ncbi:hypothetical protein Cgig2_024971 [Carnegiea gigantea]|uniref:SWIM-type domain-containing protein n=1 Tax=Carnegiea gigantea TaxID=171969 RepID=A0A9Q1JQ09_9CARY|nr:hypothetical protein Cgig2_024971 [Carnegiea gigantea]
MENGVQLPKFPGFRWHPPGRENQRWPLTTDSDWVSLTSHWGKMQKNVVIPLYIIDLPEASSLQKVVESPTQNQPQAQDQGPTQNQSEAQIQAQNDSEPSLSEARAWADNLIVTPSTEKVNPSEKSSKCQPKVTVNRPYKLPIRRSRPRLAKQPITPLQIDQALHCTSTKSKSKGLHDFDVHSLCQPQIGEVDVFDSDVEENLGQASDEESDHDDNEDNGSEEFDSLSLDEDDDLQDENESLDDVDLENDTQLRMTIGHGSFHDDVGENLLIVNKMARVFRQGKLWSRNRDGTGIIKALKNVMPQASRRICVLHFYKNFASLYLGAWFHYFFYIVANAYSEFVVKKAMDKIKDKDISAFHWLRDNEPLEHWARFKFDQTLKVDDNTNNFVESFNNAIVKHRGKPTYTMLEEIRKLTGARFDKRLQISVDWDGKVTPFVEKKLKKVELESRNCCNLVPAGRGEFDVREGSTNFTVKLADHYCDCQRWQVSGIPCKHAARCILSLNHKLDDYCCPSFNVESYRKLYDGIIHPILDSCFCGESELPALDPPFELRKMGSPEKHKRRESRLPIPP